MKNAKKIVAVLLCALVIFSMTACGSLIDLGRAINAKKDGNQTTTEAPTFEERTTEEKATEEETKKDTKQVSQASATSHISDANKDLIPEYEHYDATDFNKGCEQLKEYAQKGSEEKALELYDELYAEFKYIDALDTVIYIQAKEDVNNEKNEEEMEYMDELETDSADKFMIACHEMSVSSFADSFKKHVGDDAMFEEYVKYSDMTDREKELQKRETELTNEYAKVADGLYDYSYEYNGKTYELGDFYDSDTTVFDNIQTEEEYYSILGGCLEQFNADVGDIFLELVQIRTEIAQLNGYDNYADYADTEIYGRDYSSEDLKKFEDTVKKIGYSSSDLSSYFYYSLSDMEEASIDDYLDKVGSIASGISPYSDSAFKYFRENKLYSLGSEDCRYDAGFTASIVSPEDSNFVYYKLGGTTYDLDTLIHEMGHYTASFLNGNNLIKTMSYDVAEIHSTGLEALACAMFENAVSEAEAQLLVGTVLSGIRSSVTSGCVYDEWQRYIYSNPDMTLDEINEKFLEINSAYGNGSEEYLKYQWALIAHNFDSPMYYVSYATSAIMALQIWEETYEDYGKAAQMWESIVAAGAYSPFMETVEQAGLKPITDTNMIKTVLNDVDSVMQQILMTAYYSGMIN